jgi:hypothetical protein
MFFGVENSMTMIPGDNLKVPLPLRSGNRHAGVRYLEQLQFHLCQCQLVSTGRQLLIYTLELLGVVVAQCCDGQCMVGRARVELGLQLLDTHFVGRTSLGTRCTCLLQLQLMLVCHRHQRTLGLGQLSGQLWSPPCRAQANVHTHTHAHQQTKYTVRNKQAYRM